MSEAEQILAAARTVVLVDWPSRDVPDTLARAGYTVVVRRGPGPADYSVQEVRDGEVTACRTGEPLSGADLVYSHRPVDELPGVAILVGWQMPSATGIRSASPNSSHPIWYGRGPHPVFAVTGGNRRWD